MSKQAPTFIIEGNIGAGKSTFVSLIKKELDVHVVYEPHDQWQMVGGTENLLEKFYTDTSRWAYTFQTYAFVSRVRAQELHRKQYPYMPQVLERSVYSDRYCFAKNCFELGYMNVLEWKLYQEFAFDAAIRQGILDKVQRFIETGGDYRCSPDRPISIGL